MSKKEDKLVSKYFSKAKERSIREKVDNNAIVDDVKKALDEKVDSSVTEINGMLKEVSKKKDTDRIHEGISAVKKVLPGLKYDDSGVVKGLDDVVDSVKDLNSEAKKDKTIDVKKPKWFSLKSVESVLEDGFIGVITVLNKILSKKVNLDKYRKKENAIAVKLVKNNDMSFYEASGGGGTVLGSGSSSSSGSEVNVKDSEGTVINPSTEEKQDAIITALGASVATRIVIEKDSVDTNIQYVGVAVSGSTTDQAVWKIQRLDETTVLDRTWAGGNDTQDKIYDDRESLSYS